MRHTTLAFPLLLAFAFAAGPQALAQDAPPSALASLPPLDQLVAPVALYPDPLIGLVLAASAYPADIQAAAGYLQAGGDPNQIAAQGWNDSVKGLAHYPDVLQWMNANMPWTQQLGAAFSSQPTDVMNAVQDLRARAQAAGTLTSTPQQTVVAVDNSIAIEPAQPDAIYVPLYDPDLVYFGPPPGYWGGPFITFGPAFAMGVWLGFDFDWRGRRLWAGDWYTWRRAHGGWGHPYDPRDRRFAGFSARVQVWHPPANAPRFNASISIRQGYARPQPMRGAPAGPVQRGRPAAYTPSPAPRLRPEEVQRAQSERTVRSPAPEHGAPGHPVAKPAPKPPVRKPEAREEEHKEQPHN